jgi:hypothetical protein
MCVQVVFNLRHSEIYCFDALLTSNDKWSHYFTVLKFDISFQYTVIQNLAHVDHLLNALKTATAKLNI